MDSKEENVAVEEVDSTPDLIIITGMSGAGRTEAMHTFEDMGYFCIDNLPPNLLINLISLANAPGRAMRKLAVVCDLRSKEFYSEFAEEIRRINDIDLKVCMIFLDARDEVLLARFKETRRRHPLAGPGTTILTGINKERAQLTAVRELVDKVIDTSDLSTRDLRAAIKETISRTDVYKGLNVSVFSFGFKHGMPLDTDIVIDVRFLPNPFYDQQLRTLNGLDEPVRDYVLEQEQTAAFLERWQALLDVIMPGYVSEGKLYLSIGIGCTGGQHRSVVLADETAKYLRGCGYEVSLSHRDIALAEVI